MTLPVDLGPTADLPIGGPDDRLFINDSFDRIYEWVFQTDCVDGPVDFTGFTVTGHILDSSNTTIQTFEVTPSVGDATGTFALHLDTSATGGAIAANAIAWQLRIAGGDIDQPIVHSAFTIT